ncbi:MAG: DUF4440 domain-containing protein [Fimbriimonadaceae bacterium]|nr:DUF4440 domain-containing protein [Fimbriimonadaceae bacterium]QYK55530.1 MAG: DUF4440 domain-containing protein [Fimbriimonadaceae bacterium]
MSDEQKEIVALTQELLDSVASGDWRTYERLCDPGLTAFEPEARGQLVEGLPFHRFYFDLRETGPVMQSTICSPKVWLTGDLAVIAYSRLVQHATGTLQYEETRVWQRCTEGWRHIHFHRSANG